MEKYKQLEVIGKGSFGEVVKAQNIETGEIVAIKTMKQKFATWDECMNLRELKSLRKLINKNIVKLKEVLRVQNQLSFVFEHVDQDIYKLYENQKKLGQKLTEPQVRSIFYQLAQSLSYMHKHGYFHRDLKPENILYSNKDGLVKLIDFGLAREIRSRPPYTEYVATRWYRAPELLLRATNYNSPVDIFALGCIMAELYMFKPLFNGSSELDQLQKITSVLGTPSKLEWAEGYRLASLKGITFPTYPAIPLNQVISDCPLEAIQLIGECLKWDPQKRPTASKILQHPYFKGVESVLPPNYFSDLEDQKSSTQQNNILNNEDNQPNSNSHDLNVSFGNEESSGNQKKHTNQQNINILGIRDSSPNNSITGGHPQLKKMGSQFSQSDGSITSKLKGIQNFPNPDYKSFKGLELDQFSEISSNMPDSNQASKPPLNPNRLSRQNQRNQNSLIKNQENTTTPSFNERTKIKESGFNYSEFSSFGNNHNNDHNRQSNNSSASKQQRATSLQQNHNDFLFQGISTNNNNNNQQTNSNGNSNMNQGIYNFANVNLNNRNLSQNPTSHNTNTTIQKQTINQKSDFSNQNEWNSDKNDILGTYLPSNINGGGAASTNQNRNNNHGHLSNSTNPRQYQQISSAAEKRNSNLPYNTINYQNASSNYSNGISNNYGNQNNGTTLQNNGYGGVYQPSIETGQRPARSLNSAAYMENKNQYGHGDYNISQSVNSSYRDYGHQNNQTRNFYGGSPNNLNDMGGPSSYVSQGLGNNSNTNNYSFGNSNNIYNFSAASNQSNGGGYSLPSASFGIKSTQPVNSVTNSNSTNKNIYDFNHIRQPVRNLGLPIPQFDKKLF